MTRPKIKVVCFFYNEAVLAPFFVRHYRWADCIHAVFSQSLDGTREELLRGDNVLVEPFEFRGGMDDLQKTAKVNAILGQETAHDWVVVVDADEFIFPHGEAGESENDLVYRVSGLTAHEYLGRVPAEMTVLPARMRNVFRHETDADLDPNGVPVVLQRRHGDPDYGSPGNAQYTKPIVIRSQRGVRLGLGNHECFPPPLWGPSTPWFEGTHWQNADPSFCVARRIRDRRDRQSLENRRLGLGSQHHHITEADVLRVCEENRKCPRLF